MLTMEVGKRPLLSKPGKYLHDMYMALSITTTSDLVCSGVNEWQMGMVCN